MTESLKLVSLKVSAEMEKKPEANITLNLHGLNKTANSSGGGLVDATFKAIEKIVASKAELQLYSVSNITTGTDAQGEVTVRLSKEDRVVNGQGSDTDIVIASAKAYINAVNKITSKIEKAHPQG